MTVADRNLPRDLPQIKGPAGKWVTLSTVLGLFCVVGSCGIWQGRRGVEGVGVV